jgi:hypothetical protein
LEALVVMLEELDKYLPTYLSQGSKTAFLSEIRAFEGAKVKAFYTSKLRDTKTVYQGDGLEALHFVRPPEVRSRSARGMVLSNTCDMDPANDRLYASSACYAPIFPLSRYLNTLREAHLAEDRIGNHESAIRSQEITQIFFLPAGGNLAEDGLVFLDQVCSCSPKLLNAESFPAGRIFTLTDFGAWLLALKLSIHFCRLRDGVDRGTYGT